MKTTLAAAMLVASVGLSGCATVLNGVNQPVEFNSDPDGAVIEIVDGRTCTTPCSFEMRRGNDSMVTFTRAGYQPVTLYLQSRTGGSVAGNILAGGIIGGVVDGSNGASNHIHPNPAYVRMVANGASGEAELLDEDGAVISTVAAYNAEVAADVREGMVGQGLFASDADIPAAN